MNENLALLEVSFEHCEVLIVLSGKLVSLPSCYATSTAHNHGYTLETKQSAAVAMVERRSIERSGNVRGRSIKLAG